MTKYIKTGTTEFEQFDGSDEMMDKYVIEEWPYEMARPDYSDNYFVIKTLEGNMFFAIGDWIATGVNGEHWPVKDEIFKKTYRPVWTAESIQDELAHYGYADLSYNRRVINAIWELFSGENNYDQPIFKTLE